MKRLTRRCVEKPYATRLYGAIGKACNDIDYLEKVYNKLGKLEDLEEQLGCPLEVVFKVLKQNKIYVANAYCCGAGEVYEIDNNVIYNLFKPAFTECENPEDYFEEFANKWCLYFEYDLDGNNYTWEEWLVKLSDYKKTWWLKEDKSE